MIFQIWKKKLDQVLIYKLRLKVSKFFYLSRLWYTFCITAGGVKVKKILLTVIIGFLLILPLSRVEAKPGFDFIDIINEYGTIMLIVDPETGYVVYANERAIEFYGYNKDEFLNVRIQDINCLTEEEVSYEMNLAKNEHRDFFVFEHKLANGELRDVEVHSRPIEENGKVYLFSVIYDITERQLFLEKQERFNNYISIVVTVLVSILFAVILYMVRKNKQILKLRDEIIESAKIDPLTKLHTRSIIDSTYEKLSKNKLPLALIVIDVNGLKLINDSFGHKNGDEAIIGVANALREICDNKSVLMRISGDEFMVFVPSVSRVHTELLVEKIKNLKVDVEGVAISASVGYQFITSPDIDYVIAFKNAEDMMYKYKLETKMKTHKQTLDSILINLFSKSKFTEDHSNNVREYVSLIAKKMFDNEEQIEEIRRAALLHDIGRITLDFEMIDGSDIFAKEDIKYIRKHCEKGYNILRNIKGYGTIAEAVLYHHERFDGEGYPLGIKGKDIPIYSRIIAVADAFDGMTGKRNYKDKIDFEKAIFELRKNAYTQFDPDIVEVFIECINESDIMKVKSEL